MGHREALLAGARQCLEEKGYARTTARDIAAAANANLASIGYHFGSKEALLNEAILRACDEWTTRLGQAAFAGFGAFMFVYAVTLQSGLRLGPLESAVAITPMAISFLAASLVSSRLVARFGQRVVTSGAAIQVLGVGAIILATLIAWPDLTIAQLTPGMIIAGFGQGLAMTTVFRVVLSRVPVERAGVGSGVLITTQQVSLAVGVATLGSLYLWLAESTFGLRNAFVMVMAIQVLVAIVIVVAGRKLPDPR